MYESRVSPQDVHNLRYHTQMHIKGLKRKDIDLSDHYAIVTRKPEDSPTSKKDVKNTDGKKEKENPESAGASRSSSTTESAAMSSSIEPNPSSSSNSKQMTFKALSTSQEAFSSLLRRLDMRYTHSLLSTCKQLNKK